MVEAPQGITIVKLTMSAELKVPLTKAVPLLSAFRTDSVSLRVVWTSNSPAPQLGLGHADIQTTMQYAHHVPKHDAAQRFTEAINREKGAAEPVSPNVSRTAENSAQLSAPTGTGQHPREPVATH